MEYLDMLFSLVLEDRDKAKKYLPIAKIWLAGNIKAQIVIAGLECMIAKSEEICPTGKC